MKIAQFISSLLTPLGGAEQYCLELSRWLHDAGHDITIITGWISPDVAATLSAQGIAVRLVHSARPYPPDRKGSRPAAAMFHALDLLGSIWTPRAVRAVLADDWDVVHVHRVAGFGSALLNGPRPTVLTVHDYSLVDTSTTLLRDGVEVSAPWIQRQRTKVINRSLRRARLVFPSARLREKHVAWGLELPERTEVLPHGWRIAGSGEAVPADRDANPVVFLFLGKLIPEKGVRLLLEAWGDGLPGAELWMAGAGVLEPEVSAAVAAGRLHGLGWLDEAGRRAALAAASVLLLPSVWPENFPLSAAEGVLAGLPVLSTTIASPPVLVDGVNGLLVNPDAASLRSAMQRLLDPALRSTLAEGAREVARDLDFDAHGARLLALYDELASVEPDRAEVTS
jgi:glycosyltransferase involved in cell wall biosynthesis